MPSLRPCSAEEQHGVTVELHMDPRFSLSVLPVSIAYATPSFPAGTNIPIAIQVGRSATGTAICRRCQFHHDNHCRMLAKRVLPLCIAYATPSSPTGTDIYIASQFRPSAAGTARIRQWGFHADNHCRTLAKEVWTSQLQSHTSI